jgi:putative ABC transport system permease protein
MFNDLRYAIRMLLKNLGFTAVAVLTLALGIGANTTIFSFVSASLLRPLPYKDSGQLVMLWATNLQRGVTRDVTSYPDFMDWKNQSHALESMAALRGQTFNLSGGNQPERVSGLRVSSEFFKVFGVSVMQGRAFLPEESQPGKDRVAVLSDRLWQRRFGKDASWLGKTLRLNDEGYTIVGILPSGFDFFRYGAEVYVPLAPDSGRCTGYLEVIARVKADVSLQQAQSEVNVIADRLWQQYPWECRGGGIRVETLQDSMVGDDKPSLFIVMGAVGFVLLIACANVANLLLARALARQKEFAVRSTLGAGRWRIIRQLLIESVLVALLGGMLGILLASWGVDLLDALLFGNLPLPQVAKFDIDVRVLGFALLLSMLTGVIFGLAPALGTSQPDLNESLKEGGRSHTGSVRRNHLRNLLVVSEVTLAFVLLMGAGLMIKSFLLLQRVNPGLRPENILTMNFALSKLKYSQSHLPGTFFQQVLERLAKIPGIQSAATIMDVPLGGSVTHLDVRSQGHADPSEKPFQAGFNLVSPNYFRTLGIPLKEGRDFTEKDGPHGLGVAIINETMARHFWPNEEPLGRQIMVGDGVKFGPWLSVVGIVADVKHLGLDKPARAEVFIPHLQDRYMMSMSKTEVAWMTLVVRTTSDPMGLVGSVKNAVWSIDKDQPISDIQTMEQILARSVAQPRVLTFLFGTFASLALILALGGIYAVMSYSAAQRTHEIGIRVALGAQQKDVLKLVLGQGMGLTSLGVIIGLAGAFALTRVISSFLFGVTATDPTTFLSVSALLFGVALLASYIPARRATKVDPLVALRYE